MKKFGRAALAIALAAVAVVLPLRLNLNAEAKVTDPTVFDENNIILSFGAISDTHIQKNSYAVTEGDYCKPLLRDAIDSLLAQASIHDKDGLDAIVVAGDLIEVNVSSSNQAGRNTRSAAELNAFADVIYEYKDTSIGTNFITTPGNHDWRGIYTRELVSHRDLFGDEYFESNETRKEYRFDEEVSYRHTAIVKSGMEFHFIVLQPEHGTTPYDYDPVALDYLEADLKEITTKNPNAYVFVATHVAPVDTARGSEYDWRDSKGFLSEGLVKNVEDSRYTAKFTTEYTYTDFQGNTKTVMVDKNGNTMREILPNYPQVMTFAGHSHCPLNEERSIWQGTFTALSTSSSKYTSDFPDGEHVNNTFDMTTGGERNRGGLLVQVDINGNVRITRVNFSRNYLEDKSNLVIKDAWELSHPTSDGAHLTKYTFDRSQENEAPVMSGEIGVDITADAGTVTKVTVNVPAATDDDMVHHYEVIVKDNSTGVSKTYKYLSDFYRVPNPEDMATVYSMDLPEAYLTEGEYTVSVSAVDSWGAKSNKLERKITVTGANS